MDLGIAGRRALVLGASRGIGKAVAEVLAAEGAHLVLAARSAEKLDMIASEIRAAHGVDVTAMPLDLTDEDAVTAFAAQIAAEVQPDMVLLNTGGPPPSGATGVDMAVWEQSARMMLFAVIRIAEAALGPMKARGWGRLLAVGSSGIVQPIPTLAVSNTIRGAVAGFCKSLSNDVARDGITVNMVLPGRIDTERVAELDTARAERSGQSVADIRAASAASIPMGRYGTPEEFAKVSAFLLSEPAGYVTGHMVRIDGGLIQSL